MKRMILMLVLVPTGLILGWTGVSEAASPRPNARCARPSTREEDAAFCCWVWAHRSRGAMLSGITGAECC